MREIKFRGQRVDTKEWVYGSLIQMDSESSQCFIYPFYEGASSLSCGDLVRLTMVPVIRETIGQYTGLNDKNGKKIYDGDIVKLGNVTIGFVEYRNDMCGFIVANKLKTKCCTFLDILLEKIEVEVIGSLYQNQDLLESEV